MASENNDIRESIKNIIAQSKSYENNLYFCDVVAVNDLLKTIDCRSIKGDSDITFTVKLEKQATITPMLNTQVLVIKDLNDNSYHLLKTEEIGSVVVNVNGTTTVSSNNIILSATTDVKIHTKTGKVELNSNSAVNLSSPNINLFANGFGNTNVLINGGSNGGIPRVVDLQTKLNQLENRMNALSNIFALWQPVPGDGGAALKTAWTPYSSTLTYITPTVRGDLENLDVLH